MCVHVCVCITYTHIPLVCIQIYERLIALEIGLFWDSGQIREKRTFSNLQCMNLCTSHILDFGCLRGQDVVGSFKKVAEDIPGTKITRYYLRRHFHWLGGSRCHSCPKPPKTFERKLCLFWLKEPLIKLQKSFSFL